ncbi:MAG: pitrilysin family protein [Crocinitomicaceae bacterium]|nr:pitrilysin family protein [Crocinitomicaceae bacterium]MDG1777046.1 pitrilysin family protein [Crocinitomicaceae bacterium]
MFEIKPTFFKLSNGIQVVFLPTDAFVAHMGVMIHAGSRFENEKEEGLAHFLEHCIFKGTTKRKAFDIFTDLDSVGGELNAYTNKEEMCVHASFRNNHFTIASELLGDIIQNANFPEEEIQKEKEVVLDEIISYMDSPSERIFDDFESHIFKGNSLGYNILGTKKTVSSFTREDLLSYVDRYFTASNMVVSFVGRIDAEELVEVLERDFGGISGEEKSKLITEVSPFVPFKLMEKKSNFQTHTLIGGRAPSYNDPERRGMTLLTNVLGGPALNSRLTLSIREKYGYAYNVEANYTTYSDVGFWSVYMGTDKKYLKKAVALIYDELALLCEQNLTEKELEQAREQLKGHIALSLDSNMELMFSMAKSVMIHGRVDSIDEVYSQLDAITIDELEAIANKSFSLDNVAELIYKF